MRIVWLLAFVPSLAAAEPRKLTYDEVMAKALASPRAQMADGDRDAAAARIDEADGARLPRIKLTAFGTVSPVIHCDNTDCTRTSPTNFALDFGGVFASAQLDVTQPLYTFGKIQHARAAARAGKDAQDALADETAGDLAVDAARAYWGLKLARELGAMLDDGIEEIDKAVKEMNARTDKTGKPALSIQDRQRVAVLLGEAKAQRADATLAELQAIAGLRALVAMPDADIDDTVFGAVTREIGGGVSPANRPLAKAAQAGAHAADELAEYEAAYYYPDFALIGSGIASKATRADDPPSAFAYDPYNRYGVGLVLGMSWTPEIWNVKARTGRARAEARKAHAQSDLAALGARYDADGAFAEAKTAHDKLAGASEGEKAARTWLASVLQAEAIGIAESRDLADSYIAWFTARSRWASAVFQWNVAVVRLERAAGEFGAGGRRPKEK